MGNSVNLNKASIVKIYVKECQTEKDTKLLGAEMGKEKKKKKKTLPNDHFSLTLDLNQGETEYFNLL
jgi:hypothetical protein